MPIKLLNYRQSSSPEFKYPRIKRWGADTPSGRNLRFVSDDVVITEVNVNMGKKDLSDIEQGIIVGGRRAGASISEITIQNILYFLAKQYFGCLDSNTWKQKLKAIKTFVRKRLINESSERRVAHTALSNGKEQQDKLQQNAVQVYHKAYPNAMILQKSRKGANCGVRSNKIGHLRTIKKWPGPVSLGSCSNM